MLNRRSIIRVLVMALGVWSSTLGACKKEPSGTTAEMAPAKQVKEEGAAAEHEASVASAPSAEMTAKLAKADAMDGATDHVVSKCGMCALRMNGSNAHVSKVGDYELHFCSGHCKESFDEDQTKAVLALNVED